MKNFILPLSFIICLAANAKKISFPSASGQTDCDTKKQSDFSSDPAALGLVAQVCKWKIDPSNTNVVNYKKYWKIVLTKKSGEGLPWADKDFPDAFLNMMKAEKSFYRNLNNPVLENSPLGVLQVAMDVNGERVLPPKDMVKFAFDLLRKKPNDENVEVSLRSSLAEYFKHNPKDFSQMVAEMMGQSNKDFVATETDKNPPNYLAELAGTLAREGREDTDRNLKAAMQKALVSLKEFTPEATGATQLQLDNAYNAFLEAFPLPKDKEAAHEVKK